VCVCVCVCVRLAATWQMEDREDAVTCTTVLITTRNSTTIVQLLSQSQERTFYTHLIPVAYIIIVVDT